MAINCFGETNRQILEDIRDEIEFIQYERELRSAYGGNQQVRPQPQPDSYLQIMSYSRLSKGSISSLYIKDASISKIGSSGHFLISYLIQFTKPQYSGDKTFFAVEVLSQSLYCKNSSVSGGQYMGLNKEYKAVVRLGSSPLEKIPAGGNLEMLKNYVCP